jgi:hypothetical protein
MDSYVTAPHDVTNDRVIRSGAAPPTDIDIAKTPNDSLLVFRSEATFDGIKQDAVDDRVIRVVFVAFKLASLVVAGASANADVAIGNRAITNDMLAGCRESAAFDFNADRSFGAGLRPLTGLIVQVRTTAKLDALQNESGPAQADDCPALLAIEAGEARRCTT